MVITGKWKSWLAGCHVVCVALLLPGVIVVVTGKKKTPTKSRPCNEKFLQHFVLSTQKKQQQRPGFSVKPAISELCHLPSTTHVCLCIHKNDILIVTWTTMLWLKKLRHPPHQGSQPQLVRSAMLEGAGKIVHWLKAPAVLAKDLDSVSSTLMVAQDYL